MVGKRLAIVSGWAKNNKKTTKQIKKNNAWAEDHPPLQADHVSAPIRGNARHGRPEVAPAPVAVYGTRDDFSELNFQPVEASVLLPAWFFFGPGVASFSLWTQKFECGGVFLFVEASLQGGKSIEKPHTIAVSSPRSPSGLLPIQW